jgi:hypothetical protein
MRVGSRRYSVLGRIAVGSQRESLRAHDGRRDGAPVHVPGMPALSRAATAEMGAAHPNRLMSLRALDSLSPALEEARKHCAGVVPMGG